MSTLDRDTAPDPSRPQPPEGRAPAPGDVVGGYRLVEIVGTGGMGVVWRAEEPGLGRSVAVKLISPGLAHDEAFRRRFLAEAHTAAALEHPNVLPVHRAGEDGPHLYIAMRLVEGESLHALVGRTGRLSPGRAVRIVAQAAAALDAAHARGIVHRDVKPANLLIADPGGEEHVYLSDFGLSSRRGTDGDAPAAGAGTPAYLAPEQVRGEEAGPAADVYALGCVLVHALTGAPPHTGDPTSVRRAHLTSPPPLPSERVGDVPGGFDAVVARALAKDPAERFPSAGELARAALAVRDDVVLVAGPDAEGAAGVLAAGMRSAGLGVARVTAGDPDPVRSADTCAVLIAAGGLGAWAREPLALAESLAARDRAVRIVGVLLPGAPDPLDPNLAFLAGRPVVDLRRGVDDAGVRALARLVRGHARVTAGAVATPDVCPYQGLAAFGEEQAGFFHGREEEVTRALALLGAGRFLAVTGPSGSGKSSLVRAGVVPALRADAIPGGAESVYATVTPGPRPLTALWSELRRVLGDDVPGPDDGGTDPTGLDRAAAAALRDGPADARLVLVVDQFEEVFTLADPAEAAAVVDALVYAASIPEGRVVVILTMRADFTAAVAGHARLAALTAGRQLIVGPLGPEGLRRAIEEPARAVGLDLEEGLTRRIVADVRDRPGALPLLEHLLVELWRRRRDGMLTLEAYEASGGIEGALAQRADAAYAGLPDGLRDLARRILLRLVNPGDGAEDTRRRVEIAELAPAESDARDVRAVVEALAADRLLTVGRDEGTGGTMVEITHEALLRAWPTLREWLDDAREDLRRRVRLAEAAGEWEASGRDEALLYRGARLATWQEADPGDLTRREADFLAASVERGTRERAARARRVRLAFAGLAAVLVLVAAGAGVALWQRGEAQEQRDIALSRQLAVNADTSLDDDPELALLLAREADAAAPTPAAEEVLRQATEETRLLRAVSPRGEELYALDAASEGALLAVGTSEGEMLVVDAGTGEVRAARGGAEGGVSRVDLSRDGRLAAGGDDAGTVTVWDWGADRIVRRVGIPGDEVRGVSLSPTADRVAVAFDSGAVRVWRVADGRELRRLSGHRGRASAVAWHPDGRRLATAGNDATVRVWDVRTGSGRVLGRHGDDMYHLAWSPDGRRLVSSGDVVDEGYAYVWDVTRGGAPVRLGPQGSEVYQAAWSPDGRSIATGGSDSAVLVWNATGGPPRLRLRPHDGTSNGVAFQADGRTLASTDAAGTLRVWDVAPERVRLVLDGHETGILGADWSPDGRRVVSGGNDRTVRVWDLGTGRSRVLRGHTDEVWGAAFSPDGRRFVTGGFDGTLRIWDARTGRTVRVIRGRDDVIPDATWSPAGPVVASGDVSGRVLLHDADSGRRLAQLDAQALVWGTRFSADGTLLVTGGQDGVARVWDWRAGRELATLTGAEGAVWRSSFSPDARYVATNGDDGVVRVWDWRAGSPPRTLRGHRGRGFDAVFSPDGTTLATSGEDQTVRIWDWRRGVTLAVLRGHTNAALRLAWTRDGTRLLSSSDDGDLRIWTCGTCGPLDEVRELARARTVRDLTPEERAAFLADE